MKKLNEKQLEDLNAGDRGCVWAMAVGALAGIASLGVGSLLGASAMYQSVHCQGEESK